MEIPANLIGNTIVPHAAWNIAVQRVIQCYEYAREMSNPQCVALIGETRLGKTRLIKHIQNRFPEKRSGEGYIIPVLRVKTPSQPTPKGIAEAILYALHDPLYGKGSEQEKTFRIITLLNEVQARLMFFDDFQHFYDKTTDKVQYRVCDWLKNLVDDSQVALGICGLETCKDVIEQNEQLAARFMAPINFKRLDWKNDDDRKEFLAILQSFHEALGMYFDIPEFDNETMGFRWYCATGGLIGYIAKVLDQLVKNVKDELRGIRTPPVGNPSLTEALKKGGDAPAKVSITLDYFQEAHIEAVWAPEGLVGIPSPFSKSFSAMPDPKLMEIVQQIGKLPEPKEDPEMRYRRASKKRVKVSTVFTTR